MGFLDLQNPDHAYLFGFLQADGHLTTASRNRGRLSLEINQRDASILERFQAICPFNSTVSYRTRKTNYSQESKTAVWTVCAREFRLELIELGLPTGRKSHSIAPPVVPIAERDYVRGLIDADGSLGITAKGLPFVAFTSASDLTTRFIRSYAEREIGAVRTARRNKRDSVYNLLYMREAAVRFAEDLYYPGALSLQRKADAAGHVRMWTRPPEMRKVEQRRRWSTEEDQQLLVASSPAAAARLLNRSESSCLNRRWRLRHAARQKAPEDESAPRPSN